jgi:hypothetical protein
VDVPNEETRSSPENEQTRGGCGGRRRHRGERLHPRHPGSTACRRRRAAHAAGRNSGQDDFARDLGRAVRGMANARPDEGELSNAE